MLDKSIPQSQSPLHALVGWFRRQRERSELAQLDSGEAHRIAADLQVSVDDLVHMASQSDDEVALMGRMMALHGIDKSKLDGDLPAVVRQMAVTCSHCDCKGHCSSALDNGVSTAEADTFCPNAELMQEFSKG